MQKMSELYKDIPIWGMDIFNATLKDENPLQNYFDSKWIFQSKVNVCK